MAFGTIKVMKGILAFSALISIVGVANSAAISSPSGSTISVSSLLPRAHAGPDSSNNNPHSISPDADPLNAQTDSSDLCKDNGHDENGTWFCSQVDQVLYTKVSGRGSGTYEAVTLMDANTGRCDKATRAWSGELAPFNEPISLHFHGPLHLKQVAFYQPNSDGSYSRKGFYHAQSQTAEGITFMGNFGGTAGSGVFTPAFGNSLSFVNSRGDGGASQPTILADTTVSDTADFSMFTSDSCSDGSCGYIQPGAAALKGFPGPNRMFLFEFSMPHSPSNADGSDPSDKPALWLLNARIPYTQQYDKCSCWNFGCGEFDIFEVVNKHDEKALSTFHLNPLGFGDPNYFRRPSDGPIKVALFMDGSDGGRMSVKLLGRSDGARFGGVLSAGQVNELKKKSEGRVSEYEIRWPAV